MKNYLIVCLLILSSISFGQDWIDLANVYFRTSPFNSIQGSSDQRHLNSVTANIKLPKVIDENNVILFGLEHQYNSIVSPSSSSLVDLEFSSTMLQIGWEHKWNKKTKILFMSMTRLNSDFKNVGILHFQQGGVIWVQLSDQIILIGSMGYIIMAIFSDL